MSQDDRELVDRLALRNDEIEVTPEMEVAGRLELWRDRSFETDQEVATRVYRAMRQVDLVRQKRASSRRKGS